MRCKGLGFIAVLLLAIALLLTAAHAEEACSVESETCSEEQGTENPYGTNLEDSDYKEGQICIMYFYGDTCPKCAKIKPYLEEIKTRYSDKIHFQEFEIYNNLKNYQIYNSYCGIKDIALEERGVPFLAIGNAYYMGVTEIKTNLELKIEEMLKSGERICPLPEAGVCANVQKTGNDTNTAIKDYKTALSWPLILGAGLVDGINPCAFAVLIFLLAFLLEVSNDKRRMIKAGIAYIVSVYATYFLAGLGILSVIQISGVSGIFVKAAAIVAIIAGLINIKDYFWYGKGITLAIPESKKGVIEMWAKKANIPAAIVLGFLVSMFELPCTGGVYLAIIAMLGNSATIGDSVVYLLVYNLMFILPLIIITFLVVKGMKAEHIEKWRGARKNLMKLGLGVLLLALGIAMLLGWI